MKIKIEKLFNYGVLVQLYISFWRGFVPFSEKDLGLKKEDLPPGYQLGRKNLLPFEIVSQLENYERLSRYFLNKYSFPFSTLPYRFVPFTIINDLIEKINPNLKKLEEAIDDICKNFNYYKLLSKKEFLKSARLSYKRLSTLYNFQESEDKFIKDYIDSLDKKYPPVEYIRSRFKISFFTFKIIPYEIPSLYTYNNKIQLIENDVEFIVKDCINKNRKRMLRRVKELLAFQLKILRCIKKEDFIQAKKISSYIGRIMFALNQELDIMNKLNFVNDYITQDLSKIYTQLSRTYSISFQPVDNIPIIKNFLVNLKNIYEDLVNEENKNKIAFEFLKNMIIQNI
jgi:hypothetical protein